MNQRGKQRIDLSRVNKILLIRLRRIGDIVLTTPAITALKKGLPQASLTYAAEEPYRELVEGNPHLDEVLILPRKQGRKDFINLIRKVRQENFDAVLDFHGGPRGFWLTLFSGARLKAGYRTKYKSFIYDLRVSRNPQEGEIHSAANHLNLVRALGISVDSYPPLCLPAAGEEEVKRVESFLVGNQLKGKKLVILHISAGNRFRDWGVKNIVRLTELLGKIEGLQIVLIGGSEDRAAEQEVRERSAAPLLSLAGQLNLRELRELISRAALFVGPDSGPMHVAASTATPLVAYFGPTLPVHFEPWQAQARILEKEIDCRPCRQRKCGYGDFRCLQRITPEEVYEASLGFLR